MSKIIKNIDKYNEEVTIKGNPGIPGEGYKDDNDNDYLSNIENRKSRELGGIDRRMGDPEVGRLTMRIMQLVQKSKIICSSKKEEVEKLALNVIISEFGDLLEDVDLDIKLIDNGLQAKKFMDDEGEDSESGEEDMPNFKEIKDQDLINKIHKAKIANNIIQGEAKNTKHILHSDFIKSELIRIFGEREGKDLFNVWDEITKIADKLDWYIPVDVKSDMMENIPQGFAGANTVKWKKEDQEDDDESMDIDLSDDDEQEFDDKISYTPTIKAVGIDFPMLIHETVKGIYELIASVMQPSEGSSEKEIQDAETVKMNVTSFDDEAEDFRYGPELASDFRDFINENPAYNKYPLLRSYVFGKMCDTSYLSDKDFLELFRGILNKTQKARKLVDDIIDDIVSELEEFERSQIEYNLDNNDDYIDNNISSDIDNSKHDDVIDNGVDDDYSKMSKKDLQKIVDDALDRGDYDTVGKASKFLENKIYKFKK